MKSAFERRSSIIRESSRHSTPRTSPVRDDMAGSATASTSGVSGSARLRSRRRFRPAKHRMRGVVPNTNAVATDGGTKSLPLIDGPCVWRGPELLKNPETWTHRLTATEIEELDDALRAARENNLDIIDLSPANFPLPTLGSKLKDSLKHDLVRGKGIHLMKGLPVERYSMWEICAAFFGMGSYLGWHCPQNAKGHVLGHVKDLGNDPNNPQTRIYTTSAAQPFHTDSADIVGLLCIANSTEGGESQVISTAAVYNELVTKNPTLAECLTKPFPVDRKGEVPVGKKPTYPMPVFHVYESDRLTTHKGVEDEIAETSINTLLSGIYDRNFIDAAQKRFTEEDGVARLTSTQTAALDALDALCDSPNFRLDMRLEPGDVQWLHNHTTLHARSAYSCSGHEFSQRHLLRLWITPDDARELPPIFSERFGNLTPGPNRGGIRVEGQKPYCALEPGA